MKLSKSEVISLFNKWLVAWNEHDLDEVMELMHEDVEFENWTGSTVKGKKTLKRSWIPWFANHGDFKFNVEDVFFDENDQKMLFMWKLEWPSTLSIHQGKTETRRGVDVLHFKNGKIIKKYSYSKTTVIIDQVPFAV